MKRLWAVLGLACTLLFSGAVYAQDAPVTLDDVLGQLSDVTALSAAFEEEKSMDLLAAPLSSAGALHYVAPDRLVKRTSTPRPSTVLIHGSRLQFADGDQVHDIDLDSQPVVREFVDGFRHVLSGDRAALETTYGLEFASHTANTWVLTLSPKGADAQRLIRRIVVQGSGPRISELRVEETIGDVTTTRFTNVELDKTFTPEDLETLFSVP